jgi:putative transposase
LAVAAQRHDIDILDVIQMSNHLHEVIYDRQGNAPAFYADFHRLLAKCVNVIRGRWENFFSSEQTSVVRIETTVDLIDRLVYVATNPVKAGLVARVDDWPGVSGLRSLLGGEPLRATRPKYFFSEDGVMPEEVTLQMTWPLERSDRDEVLAEVEARVAQFERDKAAELKRAGRRVLGRHAVIHQSWSASPTTFEPRRQTKRTIAARCKWKLFEALQRRRDFVIQYREARDALLVGVRIPFPPGTYWLRRFAGVEVGLPKIWN